MQQNTPFIFNRKNVDFVSGKRSAPAVGGNRLFYSAVLVVLAAFLSVFLLDDLIKEVLINLSYGSAEAVITEGEASPLTAAFPEYILTFAYNVGNKSYTGKHEVSEALWEASHIGDPVQIRYSTLISSLAYIVSESAVSPGRSLWTSVSVVIFCGGIGGALWLAASHRQRRDLAKNGQLITGTLISANKTLSGTNRPVYHAEFEFLTPEGIRFRSIHSVKDEVSGEYRPTPLPGTPVLILYENEKRYLLL